jgi:ABC-type nitrate/sulfonate/bicarbonate transport system permease component
MRVSDQSVNPTVEAELPLRETAADRVLSMRPGREEQDPVRYRRRRRRYEFGLAWIAPILFVLAWQWASRSGVIDAVYFPAPSDVWTTLIDLIRNGTLQEQLWTSLKRLLLGYAFGAGVGVLFGVIMGLSRTARSSLDGILTCLYMVPKLAILPLLLLLFGLGETPKILMIAITVFFFMWLTSMAAFMSTPRGYDETARSFGANKWQRFRHVQLPAALPAIFVGLRLNIGVALLMVVSVEFVASSNGIGWLIWNSWTLLATRQMYAGIVAVSVTGVILTMLVRAIGRIMLPWASLGSQAGDTPF